MTAQPNMRNKATCCPIPVTCSPLFRPRPTPDSASSANRLSPKTLQQFPFRINTLERPPLDNPLSMKTLAKNGGAYGVTNESTTSKSRQLGKHSTPYSLLPTPCSPDLWPHSHLTAHSHSHSHFTITLHTRTRTSHGPLFLAPMQKCTRKLYTNLTQSDSTASE